MDVKLVMFFVLIGTIISLSNFNRENLGKVKLGFDSKRWRVVMPRRRKSQAVRWSCEYAAFGWLGSTWQLRGWCQTPLESRRLQPLNLFRNGLLGALDVDD